MESRIEYYVMDMSKLDEIKEDASQRLVRLRKAAGFTSAAAFAKHIGLGVSKYTHLEQSNASMSLQMAMMIAQGLGVTLEELAYGETEHSGDTDDLVARIDRLSPKGRRELLDALGYIEFKENRRRFDGAIRPATEEEIGLMEGRDAKAEASAKERP